MRKRSMVLCFLSVLMLFLALGCSKSEAPKPEGAPAAPAPAPAAGAAVAEGKTFFEQKCGVCHDLERAADRKETRENWAKIVKDMQEKKAGWITDAEAVKIVDFLVAEHGKK